MNDEELRMVESMEVERAEALVWLRALPAECARVVVLDPPYARQVPQYRPQKAGLEHQSAAFAPFALLWQVLAETRRVLVPGGAAFLFLDWRLMADAGFAAVSNGLRSCACYAWVRNTPGTGSVFRSSWDPVMIFGHGQVEAVDRAAVLGWGQFERARTSKRRHPHEKPVDLLVRLLSRVARPSGLVIDPFAGSCASRDAAIQVGMKWRGCDVDATESTPLALFPPNQGQGGQDVPK